MLKDQIDVETQSCNIVNDVYTEKREKEKELVEFNYENCSQINRIELAIENSKQSYI